MARAKSKFIKVLIESIVSGHKVIHIRSRAIDPIEVLRFDPKLQAPCIYREVEKIGSHKR